MAGATFSPAYARLLEVLIAARRDAGLTQAQVAERLGKPQSHMSKLERGERRIDVVEFCALADALRINPTSLLQRYLAG